MSYHFRKATPADKAQIWDILQQAILRRRRDGSLQWQEGYPNEAVVEQDIEKGVGYVLTDGATIAAYSAILFNDEPAYDQLKGNWLSNEDFVVVHRLAVSDQYAGKGLAQVMLQHTEALALEHHIYSIKADTNFDNAAMLRIFEKLGYSYCGEVTFRGGTRMAFEKLCSR